MLFTNKESTVRSTPIWDKIRDNSDFFISKLVFKSMFGYALAQKKLARTKRDRYISIETGTKYLDSLTEKGIKKLDEVYLEQLMNITSSYVNKSGRRREYIVNQPIDQINESLKKELNKYGHRAKAAMKSQEMEHRYDWKFSSHSIRLLVQCIEIAETGKLVLPLKEAELIRDVKFGKYTITEVENMFDDLDDKFNIIKEKSPLRATPDYHNLSKLLMELDEGYLFQER